MNNNFREQEKSGGRRLPLYAEVGRFFSPDGRFDRDKFRSAVAGKFSSFQKKNPDQNDFRKRSREWISSYLNELMDYLEEKNMGRSSFHLFTIAMEECDSFGVDAVTLSPARLNRFMAFARDENEPSEKTRILKDDKRRKIFDAALQVFSEEGFHRATMDRIASVSGVGKGSVYRYFTSKEDLMDQLLNDTFSAIVEGVSSELSREGDILSRVQAMVEFWVRYIEENPQAYRLIQSEAINQNTGGRNLFYDYLISHMPMLKERIVSLNKDGKLKTTSFYTVFYGVLGFIDGVTTKWFRANMDYPLSDEIPIILEVLFNGFVGEKWTQQHFYIPPEENTQTPQP